jgi:UDP-N-acetylmuramate-alanine ligase
MKYHFIGICGAGMSAVAKLLVDEGETVTGSDEGFYPPISDYLVENKIPCTTPFSPNNIPDDIDRIVIGKHAKLIPEENEEVKAAFDSGKPILSFPQVLEELSSEKENMSLSDLLANLPAHLFYRGAWNMQQRSKLFYRSSSIYPFYECADRKRRFYP